MLLFDWWWFNACIGVDCQYEFIKYGRCSGEEKRKEKLWSDSSDFATAFNKIADLEERFQAELRETLGRIFFEQLRLFYLEMRSFLW